MDILEWENYRISIDYTLEWENYRIGIEWTY